MVLLSNLISNPMSSSNDDSSDTTSSRSSDDEAPPAAEGVAEQELQGVDVAVGLSLGMAQAQGEGDGEDNSMTSSESPTGPPLQADERPSGEQIEDQPEERMSAGGDDDENVAEFGE